VRRIGGYGCASCASLGRPETTGAGGTTGMDDTNGGTATQDAGCVRRVSSQHPRGSRPAVHPWRDADTGEPDELKGSRPVRRGANGKGSGRLIPRRWPTLPSPKPPRRRTPRTCAASAAERSATQLPRLLRYRVRTQLIPAGDGLHIPKGRGGSVACWEKAGRAQTPEAPTSA
jgi:hypothetical protein